MDRLLLRTSLLVALIYVLAPALAAAQDTPVSAPPAGGDATTAEASTPEPPDAAPDATPADAVPASPEQAVFGPYLATISIGFSHWFGGTFGAPPGMTTPGLTLGLVPTEWLELQLAYSIAAVPLSMPDASESHVGFATLAVLIRRELTFARERLMFGCGILGGIVHTQNGVRPAFGTAFVARYLVLVADGFSIGPFLDGRLVFYELPESPLPIFDYGQSGHQDFQIQLGAAMAF